MFLKNFPEQFGLGYSIHVIFLMMQSTLMLAQDLVEATEPEEAEENRRLLLSLIDLLDHARRDAEMLEKRLLN